MNVVVLQVFVSLTLVTASILLFLHSVKQADHEHADRLALLPMEQDETAGAGSNGSAKPHRRTARSPDGLLPEQHRPPSTPEQSVGGQTTARAPPETQHEVLSPGRG